MINAAASSRPTTPKSVVVTGPLERYCHRTSTVAAGAVAEANAPNKSPTVRSPVMSVRVRKTSPNAARDSQNVMTTMLLPKERISLMRSSPPIVKPIRASANRDNQLNASTCSSPIIPKPDTPRTTPMAMYPTTQGMLTTSARRAPTKPSRIIKPISRKGSTRCDRPFLRVRPPLELHRGKRGSQNRQAANL